MGWGGVDRRQGETPCCGGEIETKVTRVRDGLGLGVRVVGRGDGGGVCFGRERRS